MHKKLKYANKFDIIDKVFKTKRSKKESYFLLFKISEGRQRLSWFGEDL